MKHLSILVLLLLIGCIGSPALAQTEPMLEYISSPETIKELDDLERQVIATLPPSYRLLREALTQVEDCEQGVYFAPLTSPFSRVKAFVERREVKKASHFLKTTLEEFISPEGLPLDMTLERVGCTPPLIKELDAIFLWHAEVRVALAEGNVGSALDRLELL